LGHPPTDIQNLEFWPEDWQLTHQISEFWEEMREVKQQMIGI
jgi:hypothetical protein